MSIETASAKSDAVEVFHVVKGRTIGGRDVEYGPRDGARFATPELNLGELVWQRTDPVPALQVPVADIIDLLVATGDQLKTDPDGTLAATIESAVLTSPYDRRVVENSYADVIRLFDKASIQFQIDEGLGGSEVLDGWRPITTPYGRTAETRAFPSRLVHVIAGNAPGVAAVSVILGAITKSVNLFKLPSNDLFTAPAILRAMAAIAPDHPVTRSFSAAYWRGGDEAVEGTLYRAQFFDKLVAWGGEGTIRGVGKYVGPGFELVAFDPKTSVSLIGREALADEETTRVAAALAADDVMPYNQEACVCSRFQFVEGELEDVDRYCALLAEQLSVDRRYGSAAGPRTAGELKEEIEVLSMLPGYRVWGGYGGEGLVIRSDQPVDFHPINKVVNVVTVPSLAEAVKFVNVATQTVGVYPAERKRALRDDLVSAGVQRIVTLGGAAQTTRGLPHDGFIPIHRLLRWVADES
jgi:hypothetical protein